jgi:hypothetical protein
MSDFFEPPPPPPLPLPGERRQPEWFGPPDNVLGVVLPLERTLAATGDVALALRGVTVYPTGAEFDVVLLLRDGVGDPFGWMPFHARRGRAGELPPDVLRLGARFADGTKATNLAMPFFPHGFEERPPGPVLMPRGGGGGGRRWDVSFWLWPLPAADPFAIAVEWPARGIALTQVDVATAPLVEAAARAEELWPDGGGDASGGGFARISRIG